MAKVFPIGSLIKTQKRYEVDSIESKAIIKQRIKELLSESTVHGISRIVKSKRLVFKIVWLIFFIASSTTGSYYVIDSIFDYFKCQTITTIKVIQEKQSQFPTVSFCGSPSFKNFTLDQIVLKLTFESVSENNLSKVFEEYKDTVWGKCFRYNSGRDFYGNKIDIVNTAIFSKPNNLRIGFNLDTPDDFREILVQIHNHSSPPIDLENGGYWLKTGSINYFEVERVFTEKLPEPYNDCLKNIDSFGQNKTLINHMKQLEKSYSQDECFRMCSYLYVLRESNCNCNTTLENFENDCLTHPIKTLYNTQIKNCVADYLKKFRLKEQLKECSQFCPQECDSMSYIISKYIEIFPTNGQLKNIPNESDLAKFETFENIANHYIRLYIYYKDLKYTLISENAKTEPFNFVSNIGGILGLFLGISFLSFIEILEVIYEIISYLITK